MTDRDSSQRAGALEPVAVLRLASCTHLAACPLVRVPLVHSVLQLFALAVNRLLGQQASIVNWNEFFAANNMRGWDISISVCTWTGVNCSSAGDIVVL